jgi:hypothetical protein
VSDYGLDDRAIRVSSPAGARDFSSNFCAQPPVQWVLGVLSLGDEARPGSDADHSPSSSAEVKK